ncbi:hypothetical protein THAOC_06137, partial [Thalassiosira oceanica]
MLVEEEFGTADAVHTIDFTNNVYVATRVCIRLPDLGTLNMAEVQVMGFRVRVENAVNLALHKPAWQSSTVAGGDASRAVDGDTNGNYTGNSVTHTENNPSVPPEWWVDLQFPSVIREIIVYNRVDYNSDHLVGAVVSLHRMNSDGEWEILKEAVDQPLTSDAIQTIDFTDDIYVATRVSIRLPNPGVLSLAEVQVMGFVRGPIHQIVSPMWGERVNLALNKPAWQSVTSNVDGDASRAVDGITNGNY